MLPIDGEAVWSCDTVEHRRATHSHSLNGTRKLMPAADDRNKVLATCSVLPRDTDFSAHLALPVCRRQKCWPSGHGGAMTPLSSQADAL